MIIVGLLLIGFQVGLAQINLKPSAPGLPEEHGEVVEYGKTFNFDPSPNAETHQIQVYKNGEWVTIPTEYKEPPATVYNSSFKDKANYQIGTFPLRTVAINKHGESQSQGTFLYHYPSKSSAGCTILRKGKNISMTYSGGSVGYEHPASVASTVRIVTQRGYIIQHTCLKEYTWSDAIVLEIPCLNSCNRIEFEGTYVTQSPDIKFGDQAPSGTTVTYKCQAGYVESDVARPEEVCTDGSWNPVILQKPCVKVKTVHFYAAFSPSPLKASGCTKTAYRYDHFNLLNKADHDSHVKNHCYNDAGVVANVMVGKNNCAQSVDLHMSYNYKRSQDDHVYGVGPEQMPGDVKQDALLNKGRAEGEGAKCIDPLHPGSCGATVPLHVYKGSVVHDGKTLIDHFTVPGDKIRIPGYEYEKLLCHAWPTGRDQCKLPEKLPLVKQSVSQPMSKSNVPDGTVLISSCLRGPYISRKICSNGEWITDECGTGQDCDDKSCVPYPPSNLEVSVANGQITASWTGSESSSSYSLYTIYRGREISLLNTTETSVTATLRSIQSALGPNTDLTKGTIPVYARASSSFGVQSEKCPIIGVPSLSPGCFKLDTLSNPRYESEQDPSPAGSCVQFDGGSKACDASTGLWRDDSCTVPVPCPPVRPIAASAANAIVSVVRAAVEPQLAKLPITLPIPTKPLFASTPVTHDRNGIVCNGGGTPYLGQNYKEHIQNLNLRDFLHTQDDVKCVDGQRKGKDDQIVTEGYCIDDDVLKEHHDLKNQVDRINSLPASDVISTPAPSIENCNPLSLSPVNFKDANALLNKTDTAYLLPRWGMFLDTPTILSHDAAKDGKFVECYGEGTEYVGYGYVNNIPAKNFDAFQPFDSISCVDGVYKDANGKVVTQAFCIDDVVFANITSVPATTPASTCSNLIAVDSTAANALLKSKLPTASQLEPLFTSTPTLTYDYAGRGNKQAEVMCDAAGGMPFAITNYAMALASFDLSMLLLLNQELVGIECVNSEWKAKFTNGESQTITATACMDTLELAKLKTRLLSQQPGDTSTSSTTVPNVSTCSNLIAVDSSTANALLKSKLPTVPQPEDPLFTSTPTLKYDGNKASIECDAAGMPYGITNYAMALTSFDSSMLLLLNDEFAGIECVNSEWKAKFTNGESQTITAAACMDMVSLAKLQARLLKLQSGCAPLLMVGIEDIEYYEVIAKANQLVKDKATASKYTGLPLNTDSQIQDVFLMATVILAQYADESESTGVCSESGEFGLIVGGDLMESIENNFASFQPGDNVTCVDGAWIGKNGQQVTSGYCGNWGAIEAMRDFLVKGCVL